MTVSLAAVFIPIVFMGGIVGRLLHEFAVTIILAILCSGIISVTLTPMRSCIDCSACSVNGALRIESPVPCRPITSP